MNESFDFIWARRHPQTHTSTLMFSSISKVAKVEKRLVTVFPWEKKGVGRVKKFFFSPQKPDRYPRDFPFLSFRQTSGKLAPRGHQLSKPAGPVPCPVTTGGVGPKGVIRGCWETRGKFMRLTCILGWFFFLVFEGERKVRGKLMLESFLGRRFSSFSFPFLPSLSLSLSSLFRFVENWSN